MQQYEDFIEAPAVHSIIPAKAPEPENLQPGVLAVNLADKVIYSKDYLGNVFEIGQQSGNVVVASAGAMDVSEVREEYVDVSGVTAISAITMRVGQVIVFRFTGALTLIHGASLVLLGGANIITAAGDMATFRCYAGGVVRCSSYGFASGAKVTGHLAFTTASSGTNNPQDVLDLGSPTDGQRGISWGGWNGASQLAAIQTLRGNGGLAMMYGLMTSDTVGGGYESSYSSSIARSAVVARDGYVAFYADAAATVPRGDAVAPTERARATQSGFAVTGQFVASTGFGCNGKAAQSSRSVAAAATDLASAIALVNDLRTALINNGIAV